MPLRKRRRNFLILHRRRGRDAFLFKQIEHPFSRPGPLGQVVNLAERLECELITADGTSYGMFGSQQQGQ